LPTEGEQVRGWVSDERKERRRRKGGKEEEYSHKERKEGRR